MYMAHGGLLMTLFKERIERISQSHLLTKNLIP